MQSWGSKDFLGHIKFEKEKNGGIGLHQKHYLKRHHIKKMKFLAIDENNLAGKGFESRIYEELIQLSNKKSIQFLNRQKIWTATSQEKICEWPKIT